jgi:hypothetical protein
MGWMSEWESLVILLPESGVAKVHRLTRFTTGI